MKTKIIAIIAVIAVITAVFAISTSANNSYPETITLYEGTDIVFKNTISSELGANGALNQIQYINFTSNGVNYSSIRNGNSNSDRNYVLYDNTTVFTNVWMNNNYKTIHINETVVITNAKFIKFFIDNTTGIPEPPPPPPSPTESLLDNVNGVWNTTLTVSTLIITWLVANQIALCGLYLYILIAVIGICKRFVNAN